MAGRTVGKGRGSVYVGGTVYLEGSTIPSDVEVGDHVFTDATDDSAGQVLNAPVIVGAPDGGEATAPTAAAAPAAQKAAPAKKSTSRSRSRSRSKSS